MSKIVDPVIDYFLQIPLEDDNILQFLSSNEFKVSKIQYPNGDTKALLFYYVTYPFKNVQFQDDGKGIENFLYPSQQSLFFILDETELTFIIKTPREEKGIAIGKCDNNMNFPVRKIRYTGERANAKSFSMGGKNIDLKKKTDDFILPHVNVQKIFSCFISEKKLVNPSDLEECNNEEQNHAQQQ